jgi:hypothetical protein
MKSSKGKAYALIFFALLVSAGCATTQQHLLDSDSNQLRLRSIQTRAFDTTDKDRTLRAIIATLQDLGFIVDKADATLGAVTATKLNRYALRVTVTVGPRGQTQLLVRANAQYGLSPVDDPEPYQQFFSALQKAMFMAAQEVD